MWYVVTRFVTENGQVIRHIYGRKDGTPYRSYSGARNAAKQMLKRNAHHFTTAEWQGIEANAVKVVTYDAF